MTTSINPSFIDENFIRDITAPDAQVIETSSHSKLPINVHYISDNGNYADTAKIEISKRLHDINAVLSTLTGQPEPKTFYHDIPAQDWRAGAFDLAQIARDCVRGAGNIIFLNCAPRRKERGLKKQNEGEGVYIGMLANGTIISAVCEDSFALFRDLIEKNELEIYRANVQIKGSQFRSRDFFTWLSQLIAFNLYTKADEWPVYKDTATRRTFLENLNFVNTDTKLKPNEIASFDDEPCVLRADCHGNLKLSLREKDVENIAFDTPLQFKIRDNIHTVILKENMFDPNEKSDYGLAAGSSGNWPDCDAGKFLELAILGKSVQLRLNITDQHLKEGVAIELFK